MIKSSACVRIFTSNGDIGCRSHSSSTFDDPVQFGILWQVNYVNDLKEVRQIRETLDYPVALLMPSSFLNDLIISDELINMETNLISGVLVFDDVSTDINICRSSEAKIISNHIWNPCGNDFLKQTYKFPIFIVASEEKDNLIRYVYMCTYMFIYNTSKLYL